MPQTLLSLAALVAAAFFTLGQKQASTHTMESIIRDEFEVAVSGALLQTTEYADSRAFDEATTPARLRARLGLPATLTQQTLDTLTLADVTIPTSAFTAPNAFGRDPAGNRAICNPQTQLASIGCNDVSDFHDVTGSTWRDMTFETPGGDPLPVEVRVVVSYVEAAQPDVIVNYRTNHKRVDVWARSPVLARRYPNTDYTVRMNRVISFDPAVALEYLRRSTCVAGTTNAAQLSRLQAAVMAAQTAAATARTRITTTAATLAAAQATAAQRESEATAAEATATAAEATANQRAAALATANAAAASANAAQSAAYANAVTAYAAYSDRYEEYEAAQSAYNRSKTQRNKDRLDAATNAVNAAARHFNAVYAVYTSARDAAAEATRVAEAAQAASTQAWAAATTARQTAGQAQQALANARQAVATAQAAATAAVAASAAADRTLAAAIAALDAFNGGCQS